MCSIYGLFPETLKKIPLHCGLWGTNRFRCILIWHYFKHIATDIYITEDHYHKVNQPTSSYSTGTSTFFMQIKKILTIYFYCWKAVHNLSLMHDFSFLFFTETFTMDYKFLDSDEDLSKTHRRPTSIFSRARQFLQRSSRGMGRGIRRVKSAHDRVNHFVDSHVTATFNGPADVQIDRWLDQVLGIPCYYH